MLVRSYSRHLPKVFLWLNFTPDPQQVHAERFSFSSLFEFSDKDKLRRTDSKLSVLYSLRGGPDCPSLQHATANEKLLDLRQDPPPPPPGAILVIFGCRALIFFV